MKGISLIRLDFDPFGELLLSRVTYCKSVKIETPSNVKQMTKTIQRDPVNFKIKHFYIF